MMRVMMKAGMIVHNVKITTGKLYFYSSYVCVIKAKVLSPHFSSSTKKIKLDGKGQYV